MFAHGRDEILALAARVRITDFVEVANWNLDAWYMDSTDLDEAGTAYAAVLQGGRTSSVDALLMQAGIDLDNLLENEGDSKDDITRSDISELIAAATLIAKPACDVDLMHMPNIPKMSRKKSESGLDVVEVVLDQAGSGDLLPHERLVIASVKHSIQSATASVRSKLEKSIASDELTPAYMTSQLRVINARMLQEGVPLATASRLYLFLRNFPDRDFVHLYCVGLVDSDSEQDLLGQVTNLPDSGSGNRTFRMIFVPDIAELHERCQ